IGPLGRTIGNQPPLCEEPNKTDAKREKYGLVITGRVSITNWDIMQARNKTNNARIGLQDPHNNNCRKSKVFITSMGEKSTTSSIKSCTGVQQKCSFKTDEQNNGK
ncbi:MAG: hypothetical protein AAF492_13545, partial [Verrucomicrobiota bacterium]